MELLDLPAEILANVIRFCVDEDNVREASMQRQTCKTFKRHLDYEVFATMPVRSFNREGKTSARTLLKNKLADHLIHRVMNINKLRGAQGFLPTFLKNCLELLRFMKVLLAVACSNAYFLTTSKPASLSVHPDLPKFDFVSGSGVVDQIAVVAAIGRLDMVHALSSFYGTEYLWYHSHPFGYPLAAAAGGNHTQVVHALLADLEYNYQSDLEPEYRTALISAIKISLIRQHTDMFLFLVDQYRLRFPATFHLSLRSWLVDAAVYPDASVYSHLTTLPGNDNMRKHIRPFETACRYAYAPYIRRFFDKRILTVNTVFPVAKGAHLSRTETPLSLAIGAGTWRSVEVLLTMGADANGIAKCLRSDLPLYRALEANKEDVFILLLLWGADVGLLGYGWFFANPYLVDTRARFTPYLIRGVRKVQNAEVYLPGLAQRGAGGGEEDCLAVHRCN
ncbi:hypothetical protein ACET3X_003736 [Alternaria dauci]|uniref:F-box domain-containing protein n=1 Tax=Alternaria dauci TaxID=48095 RepID=A0ABR3UKU9_9PLEO